MSGPRRVAVDLSSLQSDDALDGATNLPIQLLRGLIDNTDDTRFLVFARSDVAATLAHLDGPTVRRVIVPEDGPLAIVVNRLAERMPMRFQDRLRQTPVHPPSTLRRSLARWQPGVLRHTGATAVVSPFTTSQIRNAAVPLVAITHDLQHLTHPHLLSSMQRARRARAFRTAARYAARFICASAGLARVAETAGLAPERVVSLNLGRLLVPEGCGLETGETVLARYRLQPGAYHVVLGRGEPRDNWGLVLSALSLARARQPAINTHVAFVGPSGRELTRLKMVAERMGLIDCTSFITATGAEEQTALIRSSRTLIWPALYDELGDTVLQAMTHGTPVVCSQIPFLMHLTDGAALTFDPHRPVALADMLELLESNPSREAALSAAGQATVARLVDRRAVARAFWRVVDDAEAEWQASP